MIHAMMILAIIGTVIKIWIMMFLWMKKKIGRLVKEFYERTNKAGDEIVLSPQSCLYRGSDSQFGNIRGNGIICITKKRLMFEKLTGQRIEIDRSQIVKPLWKSASRGKRHLQPEETIW